MNDLIEHLKTLTNLSDQQIGEELARRGGQTPLDRHKFSQWNSGILPTPAWLERAAARWIIELWQSERNECESKDLWAVDKKYSKMLNFLTVAEIIGILNEVKKSKDPTAMEN